MQARRASREHALQILYQLEFLPLPKADQDTHMHRSVFEQVNSLEQVDESALQRFATDFFERFCPSEATDTYALRLVEGVVAHLPQIDRMLTQISHGWKLARMAAVDRNVLRIAAYELLFETSLPQSVVINEAIEVARRYGAQQSAAFVNGVLDALAHKRETSK